MGSAYAYLRVSTDAQDTENQKNGIQEYAKANGFEPSYIEDTASGRLDWQKRSIGKLFNQMKAGDVLIVSEISRLSRSTIQVLEMLRLAAEREISVHVVKGAMKMDGSLSSKITATVLGRSSAK
jgi:DNA invertase Pin-like site-specific DNA recombinase